MPDHSSDATATISADESEQVHDSEAAPATRARARSSSERPQRTDWRLGGRTVGRWREWLLATALISLGIGILAGAAIGVLWQSPWATASATAVLWLGMLVPIVWAFSRSRPVGLLRFRPFDLLYGLVFGLFLRIEQGWLDVATGGSGALPSYALVNGTLPGTWWFTDGLSVVAISPLIEEFFFRAVILVALYTVLRRPLGKFVAGLAAVLITTGLFVLLHGLSGSLGVDQVVSLALLGVVSGALVALTGRIWGAVLVHLVFNASYVVLALAGTHLS